MGNINRLPRGLLSYLDSQTQGENPDAMGSVVAPVLNIEPFYRSLVGYEHRYTGGAGFDVPPVLKTLNVPSNEVWLVHSVSGCVYNLTGVNIVSVSYSVVSISENGMLYTDYLTLASGIRANLPDQGFHRIFSNFPSPYVAQPGGQISLCLDVNSSIVPGLQGHLTVCMNRLMI